MKKILFILLFICLGTATLYAQGKVKAQQATQPTLQNEDEMKTYVMVFLKTGPKRNQTKEKAAEIQEGHMAHLNQMHQDGVLLMAGPFMDEQDIKGILVMNASNIDEVKHVIEQDPAIQSGRLIAEYHLWYTKSGVVTLP